MRQVFFVVLLIVIMTGVLYALSVVVYPLIGIQKIISPITEQITQEISLDDYAIENLRVRPSTSPDIIFTEMLESTDDVDTYLFRYDADGKNVTGQAHIPVDVEQAPVIIMFRGYADQEVYDSGYGTARAAEVFAENGFITLAPDFLGYGGSDMPSEDPMEERFEKYIAGLSLIDALVQLPDGLEAIETETTASLDTIGIWGHSNGGQISLVMLEVTGADYPTTLWNPVTKPFPYSILYYTDDYDDNGKALRKLVADFEAEHDVDRYSLTNYLDWIQAPIMLHQGAIDPEVPQEWSDDFVADLEEHDIDVTYYVYPGNDHNFAQSAWNTVVNRDIDFFKAAFEAEDAE